jgi:LysM repeat protein
VDPDRRRELTRYGAPALFLAAVTVAVLLVKSGLNGGSSSRADTSTTSTTTPRVTTQATTSTKLVLTPPPATTATSTVATTAGAQYYVIQTGDTLEAIAAKYNTSVDQLLTLNPGLDPSTLQPGARIRVG